MSDDEIPLRALALWALSFLALLASAYCALAAVMNGHFAFSADNPESYNAVARLWVYGSGGLFVVTIASTIVGVKVYRRANRVAPRRHEPE